MRTSISIGRKGENSTEDEEEERKKKREEIIVFPDLLFLDKTIFFLS
jgi:hypothetical protein